MLIPSDMTSFFRRFGSSKIMYKLIWTQVYISIQFANIGDHVQSSLLLPLIPPVLLPHPLDWSLGPARGAAAAHIHCPPCYISTVQVWHLHINIQVGWHWIITLLVFFIYIHWYSHFDGRYLCIYVFVQT